MAEALGNLRLLESFPHKIVHLIAVDREQSFVGDSFRDQPVKLGRRKVVVVHLILPVEHGRLFLLLVQADERAEVGDSVRRGRFSRVQPSTGAGAR